MFPIISSSAKLEVEKKFLSNKRRQGGINKIPFGMKKEIKYKREYMKEFPGELLRLPGKC